MKFYKLTWPFIIGIILDIIGNLFSLCIPLVIRHFVDSHSTNLGSQIPQVSLIGISILLATIFSAIGGYLVRKSGDKLVLDLRTQVETHLLQLPLSFFSKNTSGNLTSRVVNDSSVVKEFMSDVIPGAISSVLTLAGSFSILLFLDWKLTSFILLSFSLISLVAIPIGKVNETFSIKMQDSIADFSSLTAEAIQNVKVIKLNNAQKTVLNNINQAANETYSISRTVDKIFSVLAPIQTALTITAMLAIVLYGSVRVQHNTLSIGTLTSFLIYIFQIITPINTLANFYPSYALTKGATNTLSSILDAPTENDIVANDEENIPVHPLHVSMNNIEFSYDSNKLISNVSIAASKGEKVALVGPSGSGKSTIINLLTRLYEPNNGEILINDLSANKMRLYAWRSMFGVVTQENTIMSGTLLENLILGLDYVPSNEQLEDALKAANIWDEVQLMPHGIDSKVSEQGINLSGGQRQRIQIARAYLKNADFLIFDEATASLDSDSEKKISDSINSIRRDKGIITIAHRLSTITDADRIYFIDHGRVVGVGTHSELVKLVPMYATFVSEQML